MNPGFPHQPSSIYYPTSSAPKQTAHGQSATNGPDPNGAVQHERIKITRTIRTEGLKPDLHCCHSEQPPSNPLQPGRVRADYAHQPYFNQQPLNYPPTNQYSNTFLTSASQSCQPIPAHHITRPDSHLDKVQYNQVSAEPTTDLQTQNEITDLLSEICDKPTVPPQNLMGKAGSSFTNYQPAHIYASHSICPGMRFSDTKESAFWHFSQGNQAFHPSYPGFRAGANASIIGYGQQPLTPTIAQPENFIPSPLLSSPRKRLQNQDLSHQAKFGAFTPTKPYLDTMAYNSNSTTNSNGANYQNPFTANQMNHWMYSNELQRFANTQLAYSAASSDYYQQQMAQTAAYKSYMTQNLPTPHVQNRAAKPLPPGQSTRPEHSANSYPVSVPASVPASVPVSSPSADQPGSSSLIAPANKSAPQDSNTLQQSTDCPDTQTKNTSKETHTPSPESKASDDSGNEVDFNWQAPEFQRDSDEIVSLIHGTENLLGIQKLDLPWITTAQALIIAADAIDGNITEATMHILRLGLLMEQPNEPDNPFEDVSPEMAKLVNDWYEQSEEDKIESEYFELLNSINRYRRTKGEPTLQESTSCSSVLEIANEILQSERNAMSSDSLPPKRDRAFLTEYIQTALKYIQGDKE
ncbi:hypothetical protein [Endozoicomonas sp. GU-1]|uniref:hypothetical protein n=1 Tax=Endozoicomonas sp. GU-1 TaxID=3009078 RepID=UPI0022B5D9B6|nr:hypothetical protein [Endozoicomonas sp. GU-1]WBA79682.1 hypothetical protein O2T12_15045 [Endozoicomonas sp. GU-1]WBA87266.1 hypothetical protein O3276_04315 [Endozoicomonas sp. GU-1]